MESESRPSAQYGERLKRLLLGRALRTERGRRGLSRAGAISSLASDALSSNVYATQEILIVLALGGFGLYRYGPLVALLVVVVFAVVVAAYRYTVREYPDGGADYSVARVNLGPGPASLVAAAMLIDFALTLAVSTAAILETVVSMLPEMYESRVVLGLAIIGAMTLLSLRGSAVVAVLLQASTFAFVAVVVLLSAVAAIEVLAGDPPRAQSAGWELASTGHSATGLVLLVILARAFSSGSIAVTGVEAIGTGVASFRQPRGQNAAASLLVLGVVSMAMFSCITWLAMLTQVRVTASDADLVGLPAGTTQQTVVVQIADAVLGNQFLVAVVALITILILVAAGMSSFRSFSALSSVLARDGYLPRQLKSQGDRLVYSNGIVVLAVAAGGLYAAFEGSLTALIQLYVVGVFLALALGQAGMVRHWSRALRSPEPDPVGLRARAIAALAAGVTGTVLVVVLVSKFTSGAWLVALLIPLMALAMRRVRDHYDTVAYEMAAEEGAGEGPGGHVIALILVSRIHRPTLRAVAYARATRPSQLEAVTVAVDDRDAELLQADWQQRGIPVPLRTLESPYREINSPVMEYVAELRRRDPQALLAIYVPEIVVRHWWEQLLHNQSAARLKRRLMSLPNVVVLSVPYQRTDTLPGGEGPAAPGGVTGLTGAIPRIDLDEAAP